MSKQIGAGALAVVLLLYLSLAGASALRKSVTVDELGHLPAGVYFLLTGDSRYATLNPPLVNALSALPVLCLRLESELAPPTASDDVLSFWSNGYHFQENHRADYTRIFAAARWIPILVVAGLGGVLFACGRRLAPDAPELSGLLAAGFVCLSPNVLAHARLVGTDTGTALFILLAIWSLRGLLRSPTPGAALVCGLALGLAQLAKFYALLLYPVFLAVAWGWLVLTPSPRPRTERLAASLGGALVVSLLVLNSGYLWQEFGASLSELTLNSALLGTLEQTFVGALPLPLPGAYVRALDGQLVEVASTIPSFLFGESFEGGRWYFYLAVLAVKTPIALFVAFALALFLTIRGPRLPARELLLLLAYPVALFTLLSLSGGRQLGGRALLSAVPLVWLWAAATVAGTWPRRGPTAIAGAVLLGTLATSVGTYPDYLSYFNPFAGGSEGGYRYASDANVDIGQDLVDLASYLDEQPVSKVQLLYFGSVDPALYGIDFEIPGAQLKPGLLAVSVSLYRTGYLMFDKGRLHEVGPVEVLGLGDPIAKLGGSIHIYRVGP